MDLVFSNFNVTLAVRFNLSLKQYVANVLACRSLEYHKISPILILGSTFQHLFVSAADFGLVTKAYVFLLLQTGKPHLGMDFNQIGSSKQPDRGSNWMPGLPDNTIGQGSGPPQFPGQAGPSIQPQRPPSVIILHIFSYPDINEIIA